MGGYLRGGGVHHSPSHQVGLVPHQQPGDTFAGELVDLVHPQSHVVKRLLQTGSGEAAAVAER